MRGDKAEILGELTAKAAGLDAILGGRRQLTKPEIAAACSGVSVLGFCVLMAKYMGDEEAAQKLYQGAIQTINKKALVSDPDLAPGIARAAVMEFIGGDLCPGCQGRGSIFPKGAAVRSCKTCEGRGRVIPGQRSRARKAGIPVAKWRRFRCDEAVRKIRLILDREESDALVIFFNKIRG